jgi:hypothetical protein
MNNDDFGLKLFERINGIAADTFSLKYPINPKLRYDYPPINSVILENISNSLIMYPSFYKQTLHLMNKMNLPCPLVSYKRSNTQQLTNILVANESNVQPSNSDNESELEVESEVEEKLNNLTIPHKHSSLIKIKKIHLKSFINNNKNGSEHHEKQLTIGIYLFI